MDGMIIRLFKQQQQDSTIWHQPNMVPQHTITTSTWLVLVEILELQTNGGILNMHVVRKIPESAMLCRIVRLTQFKNNPWARTSVIKN